MVLHNLKKGGLLTRTASAVVLAPLAIGALLLGSPFLELVIFAVAFLSAWEWSGLLWASALGRTAPGRNAYAMVSVVTLTVLAGVLGYYSQAVWVLALGIVIQMSLAANKEKDRERCRWYLLGSVYISLSCLAIDWLRGLPEIGMGKVIWLFAIVWATDIGAYFVGKTIGGPKVLPIISPNKTWAGLFGGMFFAAIFSYVIGRYFELPSGNLELLVIGMLLAIIAQAGDFFESYLKRKSDKKDSGRLIPGHGGILDRIDGLMAVSIVVAALQISEQLP
ncbi:phosphatidate cytidylyltransferase [Kiloniella sp. b19]|uniref:phosphatidate cytidylyltransferase n=1 Tax=Kiloniella sp. GXU_MW_B19 TaxID=3141326 RepID=UPI0031DA2476